MSASPGEWAKDRPLVVYMNGVAAWGGYYIATPARRIVAPGHVHGLVGQLGGLDAAVTRARELAKLPADAPMEVFKGKGISLGPQLAEQANPTASPLCVRENLEMVFNGQAQLLMPFTWD